MTLMLLSVSLLVGGFMMTMHPLFLVIFLIVLTLILLKALLLFFNCGWVTMILFLIFLGGLLIIFAYLSALVPNEMKKMQPLWIILLMPPTFMYGFFSPNSQNSLTKTMSQINLMQETSFIMFLLVYLLVTLIACMVLSQSLKSPLHQETY